MNATDCLKRAKSNLESVVTALTKSGRYALANQTLELLGSLKSLESQLPVVGDLTSAEMALVDKGLLIDAVKEMRGRTGKGLIDCKRACEAYRDGK